jgi:hypothetical protein
MQRFTLDLWACALASGWPAAAALLALAWAAQVAIGGWLALDDDDDLDDLDDD